MFNMLINMIQVFFTVYTVLIFIRVLGSWIPQLAGSPLMRFVAFYTDPYLNLFRRVIPPIGGVLDVSVIVAFIVLRFLEYGLMRLLL